MPTPSAIDRDFTTDELLALGMCIPHSGFADKIGQFALDDALSPPEPGGILFVGDSDIGLWREDGLFGECFAGLPVLNRGFGGARTWETLLYFSKLVPPYRPRTIVYCCGDNDIAKLKSEKGATNAVIGFRLFHERVAAWVPETRHIFYLGIHPSPIDAPLWGYIEEANRQLRPLCAAAIMPRVTFVDYLHLLLGTDGRPRDEFFRADRLHFTPEFYRILGSFLRPLLESPKA